MKLTKTLTFLIALILSLQTSASNTTIKKGENITMVASYYMSSLWTDIAEINMEVTEVNTKKRPLFRLKCTASTYKEWDSFFKVRDLYQSWVDQETIKPYIFKRNIDEGGYTKNIKYIFKRNTQTVNSTTQRRNKTPQKASVKITDDTFDLVSVLYKVRNTDFAKMKTGDKREITVIVDNKLETIVIKYKGLEKMSVGKIKNRQCHKIGVSVKNEKLLKTKDTNNMWLTADDKKIPVLIKAKIPVGSIQIRLKNIQGI